MSQLPLTKGDLNLMGISEIAELLGVSRQRVDQICKRNDFPLPVAVLSCGRIWLGADIVRYDETRKIRRRAR